MCVMKERETSDGIMADRLIWTGQRYQQRWYN